ncbi:MAG: hypothetical protein PVF45_08865 [Anaerolineae bacterium]
MPRDQAPVAMILKTVALGTAAASVILGIMEAITPETGVTLLGIGLFALALAALREMSPPGGVE